MLDMHLYFIGYRGSGKSTVARAMAERLKWPLVDSDEVIELSAGHSIREIFQTEGEQGFRDREQQAIAQIAAAHIPSIVALGGGAVLREANRALIQATGRVVWLKGSPQQLYRRITGDLSTADRRPNLSTGGGYDEIVELLAAREPIYQQVAEKAVDTDSRSPEEIVLEIADWVNSFVG
jgi:shikimate kinase